MGELVSAIDSTGNEYWYHYDHIGNTLALTDMNGSMVNRYAYEPFGRLAGMQETILNPFKFSGRFGVMDEGDNLYYMRARYYDANLGRFISRDPMGLRSRGEVSPYVYVGNNPIVRIDPLGLWYVDFNGSLGLFGGGTVGLMMGPEGVYPYAGVVVMFPLPLGGSVTFAPYNDPARGWAVGLGGGLFVVGGQLGFSDSGNYWEIGLASPGVAVMTYYALEWKWPWKQGKKKGRCSK